MTRYTIELDGGGHFEIDAISERDARRKVRPELTSMDRIIEVRPFAAKPKAVPVCKMPALTVPENPFESLRKLKLRDPQ